MAINFVNNPKVGDNVKIEVGDSSDLQIYHDATDSFINNDGTGHLYIQQFNNDKDIYFKNDNGSGGIATYFYLDGSLVNGSSILGATRFPDKSQIFLGTGGDMALYHDGTNSFISNGTGDITIENSSNDSDIIFRSDDNSGGLATYFYLDGSAGLTKFSIATRHLDSVRAYFGQGNDLQIYHDGSNSYIKTSSSSTGDLFITSQGTNHDLYLQAADDIYLRPQGTENGVVIVGNGDVTLYYDNAAKLSTTSTGVTVTGNVDIINSSSTTAGPTLKLDATAKATWDIGDIIGEVDFFTSDTSGNAPYSAGFIQVQNDIDGGTLPSGRLVFGTSTYNGPSGAVERMRIDSAGNVGIGTTAPTVKLAVEENVNLSASILVNNPNTGTGARANLILTSDSARIDMYATSAAYNGVTSWADAGVINTSSATSGGLILNSQSGGIKFQYGTAEKMRITSDGNVGIGITSPTEKFSVDAGTANNVVSFLFIR